MSVLKSKRKPSQFEVFHHLYQTRKKITDLMLYDFGFRANRQLERLRHKLHIEDLSNMSENEQEVWDKQKDRINAFTTWFLDSSRNTVLNCLRSITGEVFIANSIYPTCPEELTERRLHQDRAIGHCFRLIQELQYIIETLEVDVNKYTTVADMIQTEINLIKGWRKSDNKFKNAFK